MRRIIFILFLGLVPYMYGETPYEYHPMLEKGKVWIINALKYGEEAYGKEDVPYYKASIVGDTLFKGENAMRLKIEYLSEEERPLDEIILMEKDRRLYYYSDGQGMFSSLGWFPLLDFNCSKGEMTIESWNEGGLFLPGIEVKDEGYYEIQGTTRRVIRTWDYWIEGVGSCWLNFLSVFPEPDYYYVSPHIAECYMNDVCIYRHGDVGKVSPVEKKNKLICENRVWEYSGSRSSNRWIEQYRFDGTEQHQGVTYNLWKLVKKTEWDTASDSEPVETEMDVVVARMREENGVVYMLLDNPDLLIYDLETGLLAPYPEDNAQREAILYDFNVSLDSSFQEITNILWENEYQTAQPVVTEVKVEDISTLTLHTADVKQYTLESDLYTSLYSSLDRLNPMGALKSEVVLEAPDSEMLPTSGNLNKVKYAEVVGNIGRGYMTALMPDDPVFLTSGFTTYEYTRL